MCAATLLAACTTAPPFRQNPPIPDVPPAPLYPPAPRLSHRVLQTECALEPARVQYALDGPLPAAALAFHWRLAGEGTWLRLEVPGPGFDFVADPGAETSFDFWAEALDAGGAVMARDGSAERPGSAWVFGASRPVVRHCFPGMRGPVFDILVIVGGAGPATRAVLHWRRKGEADWKVVPLRLDERGRALGRLEGDLEPLEFWIEARDASGALLGTDGTATVPICAGSEESDG